MKSQKFIQNYKCDCFQPDNYCNCANKEISIDVLIENITDLAESLIEVMYLCGIKEVKTKATSDVIIYYFLHFEEILHRIDSVPKKRLNKEDLMHDLGQKCGMNRREGQIAFSIIKRAFRAFYHGTGQGGVPDRFKHKLTHSSECLWLHAAQRTAQVCGCYEGMFYASQKDLECKIKLIYKQLYDRIVVKTAYNDDHECMCVECTKRTRKETLNPKPSTYDFHNKTDPYEALFLNEQENLMKIELAEKGSGKARNPCSCPPLSIQENNYSYRKNAENITQTNWMCAPFQCRWILISKEDFETDENGIDIQLPEEFPCNDCHSDEERDSKCECACEECTCETDTESDTGYEGEIEAEEDLNKNEFVSAEISLL